MSPDRRTRSLIVTGAAVALALACQVDSGRSGGAAGGSSGASSGGGSGGSAANNGGSGGSAASGGSDGAARGGSGGFVDGGSGGGSSTGGAGGRGGASASDAAADRAPTLSDAGADRATAPPGSDAARMDAQVAKFLISNPVPDGGVVPCTIPGIDSIANFERIFFQEMGVTPKTRNCANKDCHGGNYPPLLTGTGVGLRLAKETFTGACQGVNMRKIDVNNPDRSMLLWRLFMMPKTFTCTDDPNELMDARRMPLIVGQQDNGGDPNSVGRVLSQAERDCARWYVHEVAKLAKTMP